MSITIVTHEVSLGIGKDKQGEYVIATPNEIDARKGEKLRIKSKQGDFRVVFVPWPFKEPSVKDTVDTDQEFTFEKSDVKFEMFCYLTPTGRTKELGYRKDSGANGIVRP
jgi:hypothetical protein